MRKVKIFSDNISVLFPRDKKYNPSVNWTDLNIYFRYHGKMIKRCPTVFTKKKVLEEHKELLELFDRQEWTENQKKEELSWLLCGFSNLKHFKNFKDTSFRFIYDDPNSEDPYEDLYILEKKDEFGHKPYSTEIVVCDKDLTEKALKLCTIKYLKRCFNIKISLKDIKFIKNITEEELKNEWIGFCRGKDKYINSKKLGRKEKIIFINEAAKEIFGDEIKSVIIEGNKTTKIYEDGEVEIEVNPKLKYIEKKLKK